MEKYKFLSLIIFLCFTSCKKQDNWLDIKSNKSDIVPATIGEFQALLDNNEVMNAGLPSLAITGTDNLYVTDVLATTGGEVPDRNAYRWASDIYEQTLPSPDWSNPYKIIEYSNVVLDGLKKINHDLNINAYNNARGSALFYRAFAYYLLAQLYCKPYSSATANTDFGLPLKLDSDVNKKHQRATVMETYNVMLEDLNAAEQLLPIYPQYKTRPSVLAAQALLSKIYLSMENYTQAGTYANKVLTVTNTLLDFSTLNSAATYPMPNFQGNNPEILFYGVSVGYLLHITASLKVDVELYNNYDFNDLRKMLFFRNATGGGYNFRGKYTGNASVFSGLAINETLLIRAECFARNGNTIRAMEDLNFLLSKRWAKNSTGLSLYVNQTASSQEEALIKILEERRKELPITGNTRWEDLRRLNKDPRFAKTLTRTFGGETYTLLPNSPKYVFPIPPSEMNINPLEQNPR